MTGPAAASLDAAFRAEWARVLAHLARRTGDLQLAEDATQDAFTEAAARWPRDGVPPSPGGWLVVVARRKALDRLRRARRAAPLELAAELPAPPEPEGPAVEDDRLRLIFACCHPALTLESRVALTLRLVAGLSVAQVARALGADEPAMAQRLVRAKRKVREAGIPIEVPDDLAARLPGVRAVVYLVFNEGWVPSVGEHGVRPDLCHEAVRLSRLLAELVPDDPEADGLLALLLLLSARLDARVDAEGRPIPLPDQDRSRFDAGLIEAGDRLLRAALAKRRPGPYQLQAAIAALHAREEPDWPQIAALYRELARIQPSPVVEVNRAVAVAMADGPRAGLAVLEPVLAAGTLSEYAPLHAAHAELLERSGDREAAVAAWRRAAALEPNPLHRAELAHRGRNGPA